MRESCVFSYLIAENPGETNTVVLELPQKREFGKYTLCTDVTTPFSSASQGRVACAVFGLAVNVISGNSEDIAQEIVEKCTSIQDVLEYEKQLGGKYLILFKDREQYYLQGDATCSIPIFYNTEGSFLCASNCQYLVNIKNYPLDDEYSQIRNSGDISQAMPYDITPYRRIKQLIPNHYLDINRQAALRFINAEHRQRAISVEEATQTVLPMIETLLAFYLRNYKIYCPITSGRDSRVVLSFLLKSQAQFSCYTIKHPEHNDNTQDIVIPIALCKQLDLPHKLVEDVTVLDSLKDRMDHLLGSNNYSLRTLRIGQTIHEHFGDGAILNGDIIGQVGKCSLHRDIPSLFATPSYFRCKMHNFSSGAKKQLKQWLEEIKSSGEQVNTFDLFSIENRMGRWAGQTNLVYDSISQVSLNIFNCRSIIYTWTAVDRKKRKKSMIHMDLIRKNTPVLTDIPFEKDDSLFVRISKANWLTYLLSSYLKFFLERVVK